MGRTTHGMSHTPEYSVWRDMLNRCHLPTAQHFADYGGRGIQVCKRWRKSFIAFYKDVGPRPGPQFTLGRIDNDKGYKPSNVEWQTWQQQQVNRRDSRNLTFRGETMNAKAWAEKLGIGYRMLMHRLKRGWSVASALTEPSDRGKRIKQ